MLLKLMKLCSYNREQAVPVIVSVSVAVLRTELSVLLRTELPAALSPDGESALRAEGRVALGMRGSGANHVPATVDGHGTGGAACRV